MKQSKDTNYVITMQIVTQTICMMNFKKPHIGIYEDGELNKKKLNLVLSYTNS